MRVADVLEMTEEEFNGWLAHFERKRQAAQRP